MTAKDIRLGNYIASGTEFKEISSIGKVLEVGNEDRDFEQIYVEGEESFDWFFKDNYCGIPLNEDWISKLNCPETFLSKDIGGYFVWFNGEKIYLQYVHELQNLYFALRGNDLE